MAKPLHGLPGNSGHIHVSLTDLEGKNAFARATPDPSPRWADLANVSDIGYHFLAGILDAMPDIMPLFAPTINSYKRFVENFWAPVWLTWGLEDRMASIRLIAPPTCKPGATRLEIRTPGADVHPHYALSALFLAGMRGINEKIEISVPPSSARSNKDGKPQMLANTLDKALHRFTAPDSVARKLFDDKFVEAYAASREHELRLWREAVTDW
jgi:glutamine synthetase